jgi:transposase
MWRFARNNAITEGFHTKMEVLQRQAYGFGKFQNYRIRVRVIVFVTSSGTWVPRLAA